MKAFYIRISMRVGLALSAGIFVSHCHSPAGKDAMQQPSPSLTAVMQRNMKSLMAVPGVVGVGEGSLEGRPAILVLVSEMTPEIEKAIPDSLEGIPVRIDVVGEIRAH